jgi:hypothetical protein
LSLDTDPNLTGSRRHRKENRVFICIADRIQGGEEIIPTRIWLESPKELVELPTNILAAPPHNIFEFGGGTSEREIRRFWFRFSGSRRYRVNRMVERRPKVDYSVPNNFSERVRHGLYGFDFTNRVVGAIGIRLTDHGIGVTPHEGELKTLKVINVYIRSRQLASSA